MGNKSDLKVRMEFTARVVIGNREVSRAEQIMGFPDKLDEEDNEQCVISLGEGQELAGKIANQCANVAVWRAAHELRKEQARLEAEEHERYEKEQAAQAASDDAIAASEEEH